MTRPRCAPKLEHLPKAAKNTGRPEKKQRRKRVSEGIYEDQYGLAATVKVKGKQQEIRFPPGTSLRKIQAERNRMKAAMQAEPSPQSGQRQTLAHDAERYLEQVAPLVGMRNRRHEIGVWLPKFGHLRTLSLPNHVNALNAQLREWRAIRAASTVNKWRNALTNLVKVLYGRRAAAELADVVSFEPPRPQARWVERDPRPRRPGTADAGNEDGSTTPAAALDRDASGADGKVDPRGLPAGRRDLPYVAIPTGRKSKQIVALPLADKGVEAAKAFIEADAFGEWSCARARTGR